MRRVKLVDIAEITGGSTPKTKVEEFWNGDIVWLSPTDLPEIGEITTINDSTRKITKEGLNSCSAKLLPVGTVIFSSRASIGKIGINEVPVATNQGFINFICGEDIYNRYLTYVLKYYTDDIVQLSNSTTFKEVSRTAVKNFEIPLPSLSEQKAIVAKLDRAQRLIDIDREMLAKYDELIQSVFLEMFGDPVRNEKGWDLEKLGDLCGVGSSKRVYVKELVEEGIPFYRGQEIGKLSEGKSLEPELFVTEEHYQQLIDHSGKPEIGDLLMPSICPDGRIFIVKNNEKFYFKDGRVLWVKAGQSDINSFYLRYHLKALFQANYSEIASGTTFAELKIFALKKLQILNPPIELQERFQSEIERINQDIYRTKSSLKKSEDLFSSLVQGGFG